MTNLVIKNVLKHSLHVSSVNVPVHLLVFKLTLRNLGFKLVVKFTYVLLQATREVHRLFLVSGTV